MWSADAFGDIHEVPSALDEAMVELAAIRTHSLRGVVDAGEDELAAVGVTTDLEVDPCFGIVADDFCYVRVVRKENAGDFRINAVKRPLQVYFVFPKVSDPADSEQFSASFEHLMFVIDEADAGMGVYLVRGVILPNLVIVVAENAQDPVRRVKRLDDPFEASLCVGSAVFAVQEVTGNDDKVGFIAHHGIADLSHIDRVDCVAPMDVADHTYFEAFECFGQIFYWDGNLNLLDAVWLDESLANEPSDDGCASPLQDLAAGQRFLWHVGFNRFGREIVAIFNTGNSQLRRGCYLCHTMLFMPLT